MVPQASVLVPVDSKPSGAHREVALDFWSGDGKGVKYPFEIPVIQIQDQHFVEFLEMFFIGPSYAPFEAILSTTF